MLVSDLTNDLAHLFAYCCGDALIAIAGAFLGGAFIYSVCFATIFILRNQ